ncbi:MAG: hypothetical protein QMC67_05875 [Candidatus Wallbacteria bacterium]
MSNRNSIPAGVKLIIGVNVLAIIVTCIFWLLVYLKLFHAPQLDVQLEKSALASTFGFMIADILYAVPCLILSLRGLYKLDFNGFIFAQLANILWFYSVTAVLIRDVYMTNLTPGDFVFMPFVVFSIWAAAYLWKQRNIFIPSR